MEKLQSYISAVTGGEQVAFWDPTDPALYIAAAAIAFNPIYWNIMAQAEYHTHFLTKAFRSPRYGCYFLAFTIFSLGILRDHLFKVALDGQPVYPILKQPLLGAACFGVGQVLVLTSMWVLGILMENKVEGFPFNVTGSPMYWGSALCFLGTSLWKGRGAGLVLTIEVIVMYILALRYEE
jgi:phosphatidylethanolamine/phosphatidyl-N-methylethanolamine N-methyltransferase